MSAEVSKKHTYANEPDVPLTFEKAKLLNAKIIQIRNIVLGTMQRAQGQLTNSDFDVILQQELDKFHLQEGYTTEYV